MIAYINGELTAIQEEAVVVDVGGVGYEIICPNPFVFQSLLNNPVKIYTYHHVREDTQLLYGFKNEDEKNLFMKLISVSGIGPKGGLAILRGVNIPEFVSAVEREDDKFLTGFPGVGKKTARQIILDLKGKLSSTFTQNVESNDRDGVEQDTIQIVEEAKEALKALGYTDKELRPIIPTLHKVNHNSTDELVRKALGLLMKK